MSKFVFEDYTPEEQRLFAHIGYNVLKGIKTEELEGILQIKNVEGSVHYE